MRIAHLSDLHALDLTGVSWRRFLNKRLTGGVNLLFKRSHQHPIWLFDRLIDAVLEAAPDHVVITGDVSNLALESEFTAVRTRLERLGPPAKVSLIPGNHDVYTRGAARARRFEHAFAPWLWPDRADPASAPWPWVKDLAPDVTLVGFCSAVPRAPFFSSGVVSKAQLERFRALASEGRFTGRLVIAMVHHNLHKRGLRKDLTRALRDRETFLATLADGGARVVLHGHTHMAHRFETHGLDVIGSGSSTWLAAHPDHWARFNIYRVSEGRLADVTVMRHDPGAERFIPWVR
jgi:3',5'-cyclic AMP phosphodiesterase CpdA